MTPRVTIVAARMYIQPLEWKGQLKRREPRTRRPDGRVSTEGGGLRQ